MRKKIVKIPLYFGTVEIIETENIQELNERAKFDLFEAEAVVFKEIKKDGLSRYVIGFEGNCTPEIIAHECLHLVTNIFEDRGITIENTNDEPAAYLLGWSVSEVHKFLFPINIQQDPEQRDITSMHLTGKKIVFKTECSPLFTELRMPYTKKEIIEFNSQAEAMHYFNNEQKKL